MFNLTNTNIYAGDKQAYRAFLGERLIYGPAPLVYPDPPTEYERSDLEGAVFYGAGKEQWYAGDDQTYRPILEGDYTMEPNGLRLNGGKAYSRKFNVLRMSSGVDNLTIENNFDHLSPGESETILHLKGATQYGLDSTDFEVTKDSDGQVYIFGVPAPDTKFVHIYIRYYNATTYSEVDLYVNNTRANSETWYDKTSDSYMQQVYLTGNILIYDMKHYDIVYRGVGMGGPNSGYNRTTNFNGINALEFVTTEQLQALMPEPDYDPISYVGNPEYVIDFRNGQTNSYLTGTHTVDSFMQPTGPTAPTHTSEGLVFDGEQYLMNKSATSFVAGMFEIKIKVDMDAVISGGSIQTFLSVHEAGRTNRKRAIGINTAGRVVFFSGYGTGRIFGPEISSDELTIAMEWSRDSSSNNTLYINGVSVGSYYISSDTGIDSLAIGVSNSPTSYRYPGKFILQNIKHYTGANILTPEQVQQSYQTT